MAEDKYNRKNPAVKRILQEVKEMQSNPSDDFMSLPLEVLLEFFTTRFPICEICCYFVLFGLYAFVMCRSAGSISFFFSG